MTRELAVRAPRALDHHAPNPRATSAARERQQQANKSNQEAPGSVGHGGGPWRRAMVGGVGECFVPPREGHRLLAHNGGMKVGSPQQRRGPVGARARRQAQRSDAAAAGLLCSTRVTVIRETETCALERRAPRTPYSRTAEDHRGVSGPPAFDSPSSPTSGTGLAAICLCGRAALGRAGEVRNGSEICPR